jgi:DNA-binding transcriptional MocR family regulator
MNARNVSFARRMESVRASDIREMLKLTEKRDMISLAGGLPAPEVFPVAELAEITTRILLEEGSVALQYAATEGHPALRDRIAKRMNALWGTAVSAEEILVTTGSQQGLDLIGKLFIDEGDEILCESPTYVGAITAWNVFQPRWVEVATDDDGMVTSSLEERLAACRRAKLIYVVPNFQNPSGRTWSLERRRALMEVAGRWGVPVVEDNPYGEVRFEGSHLPALQSMDPSGLTIGLGTFSKILCPGLRIGWIATNPRFYGKLVILKQGADLHTSTLNQMQIAACMQREDFDARVGRIAALYRERRDAMAAALERFMPAGVRFTRPAGGLFLWLELPEGVSARALLLRCLECGVAFVPGGGFFPNGGHENTLRLNYSNMPPGRITEGIRRMAEALTALRGIGSAGTAGTGAEDAVPAPTSGHPAEAATAPTASTARP